MRALAVALGLSCASCSALFRFDDFTYDAGDAAVPDQSTEPDVSVEPPPDLTDALDLADAIDMPDLTEAMDLASDDGAADPIGESADSMDVPSGDAPPDATDLMDLPAEASDCTGVIAGTVCRASAGPCDVLETCSGSSTSCPPDGFVAAGTQCAPADAMNCLAASNCTGGSASCPPQASTCAAPTHCCFPGCFMSCS